MSVVGGCRTPQCTHGTLSQCSTAGSTRARTCPASTRVPTSSPSATGSKLDLRPSSCVTVSTCLSTTVPENVTVPEVGERTSPPGSTAKSTPRWPDAHRTAGFSKCRTTSTRPATGATHRGNPAAPAGNSPATTKSTTPKTGSKTPEPSLIQRTQTSLHITQPTPRVTTTATTGEAPPEPPNTPPKPNVAVNPAQPSDEHHPRPTPKTRKTRPKPHHKCGIVVDCSLPKAHPGAPTAKGTPLHRNPSPSQGSDVA